MATKRKPPSAPINPRSPQRRRYEQRSATQHGPTSSPTDSPPSCQQFLAFHWKRPRQRKPPSEATLQFRKLSKVQKVARIPESFRVTNSGLHILCNNKVFTENELVVLGLGLKFILNPKNITDKSILDSLDRFKRSVRIKKQFAKAQKFTQESGLSCIGNENFQPDVNTKAPIEKYLDTVECRIKDALKRVKYKHISMPKSISSALSSLLNDKSIVIKPADKNLGTCVVDAGWYESTALAQLNDTDTYTALSQPPNKDVIYKKLEDILQRYNKSNTRTAKYLLQLKDKPLSLGKFYLTIKVHKNPPTGRPICSSIGTSTYYCSRYVSKKLNPVMQRSKSYIKNSFELLNVLRTQQFPVDCLFLTADVESLYPSIVIEDGLDALNHALVELKFEANRRLYLVELTHWVLSNNFLCFGTRIYHQIRGTAMGTPLAVAYANIYLTMLENQVFKKCLYFKPTFKLPIIYKRYIDDILSIIDNVEDGRLFLQVFNDIRHGIIKLTHSISNTEGIFLDIHLFKETPALTENTTTIDSKLYQKPMNRYVYIHYKSCHSSFVFKSFIQSELKRYRILCSKDEDFITAKEAFQERLLARGYHNDTIAQWFNITTDRNTLFEQRLVKQLAKQQANQSIKPCPLVFKVAHTPRTTQLIIADCLALNEAALADEDYHTIFNDRPPILCLTRPNNLGDILVRAKYS